MCTQSHLHPGMIVPVEVDGRIEDDEIVRVDWQEYAGLVYDLNVDKVHTYIANGIVVVNSSTAGVELIRATLPVCARIFPTCARCCLSAITARRR